jgi:hypothetical protein
MSAAGRDNLVNCCPRLPRSFGDDLGQMMLFQGWSGRSGSANKTQQEWSVRLMVPAPAAPAPTQRLG